MKGRRLFWRLFAAELLVGAAGAAAALLVSGVSLGEMASSPDLRNSAVASGLVVAGAAAALAGGIAGWIERPLRSIAAEVNSASAGTPVRARQGGFREAQLVAGAVTTLADRLAEAIQTTQREAALRDEILSAMEEGVVLWGPDGRVLYANRAAGELLGQRTLNGVPPELASSGTATIRVHHPHQRELQVTRVRAGQGNSVAIVQDVTATKRLEAVRRDFVANASHELKTPVAGMLAAAETLAEAASDDPEALRRFAPRVLDEARRLSTLVSDLLDLERLEQEAPLPVAFDLAAVLDAEAEAARKRAEARGLELEYEGPPRRPLEMKGSPADIALLLRNLLDNAVNYTSGGRVRLSAGIHGPDVRLQVEDTGSGIPSADAERIFERFYRVDKARSRETGGTGLGLSIVRHVAEGHGGKVEVESEIGRGSTFTVTLPIGSAAGGAA